MTCTSAHSSNGKLHARTAARSIERWVEDIEGVIGLVGGDSVTVSSSGDVYVSGSGYFPWCGAAVNAVLVVVLLCVHWVGGWVVTQ